MEFHKDKDDNLDRQLKNLKKRVVDQKVENEEDINYHKERFERLSKLTNKKDEIIKKKNEDIKELVNSIIEIKNKYLCSDCTHCITDCYKENDLVEFKNKLYKKYGVE